MSVTSTILARLKGQGRRHTKIRAHILDTLEKNHKPLSSPDLQKLLVHARISANKTTVYRELAFLKKQSIVREVQFGDGMKRYELLPDTHHHHLICLDCQTVEDMPLEKDLDAQEKAIAKNKNFKILTHSLEFYGICRNCIKNK